MLKCDRVAPFGEPVVPLVNWMLIASSGSSAAESASSRARCAGPPSASSCAHDRQRGGTGSSPSSTTCFSRAGARCQHLARALEVDLGRDLAQHAEVVAALVAARQHQRAAADLVQRVLELGLAVRRVDVDEDQPDARGGELRDDPFVPVRRPDADAVAAPQAEREQAGRELVGAAPGGRTTTGAASRRRRSPRRARRGGRPSSRAAARG